MLIVWSTVHVLQDTAVTGVEVTLTRCVVFAVVRQAHQFEGTEFPKETQKN